jgi:DNA-binding NarL/FixJ family response regulator
MLTVLVVEDDADVARSVQQIVQRCAGGEALLAPTAAAARRILNERTDLGAFVIDDDLPDGHGLDFLALARLTHPQTPAAVYSGTLPHGLTDAAFDPNIYYISKACPDRLKSFLLHAASRVTPTPGPVDDIHVPPKRPPNSETDDTLLEAGKRLGLPPKELQILLVGAETPDHKDICARLGMRENTLRTHIHRMLARARVHGIRAANLKELVAQIRMAAASHRSSGPSTLSA